MKKITFLFTFLLVAGFSYAQDTCATAAVATVGTTTVAAVDGFDVPAPICAENGTGATVGEWYTFTASVDGIANVTTNLPQNAGGDTRVHIYTGSCGSLTCVGGNDDVDVGGGNYLSDASWAVSNGSTYYIAWDDRWSAAGFDFVISEMAVACNSTASPYFEDFDNADQFTVCLTVEDANGDGTAWIQQFLDLDGDFIDEDFATSGANGTTDKDDWLFSPAISLTSGNDYDFYFKFNGADSTNPANESLEVVLMDAPSSTGNVITTLHTQTFITQMGAFADLETMATTINAPTYTAAATGDVYLAFHMTTPAPTGFLLLFEYGMNETLSADSFERNSFTHFYNSNEQALNLNSNTPFQNIQLYNILGQEVINRNLSNTSEVINMASLKDGVYLAKVTLEGITETIKIVKR